jgi:hypothetical protein
MSDCPQLVPLVDAVRAHLGRKPREICTAHNITKLAKAI